MLRVHVASYKGGMTDFFAGEVSPQLQQRATCRHEPLQLFGDVPKERNWEATRTRCPFYDEIIFTLAPEDSRMFPSSNEGRDTRTPLFTLYAPNTFVVSSRASRALCDKRREEIPCKIPVRKCPTTIARKPLLRAGNPCEDGVANMNMDDNLQDVVLPTRSENIYYYKNWTNGPTVYLTIVIATRSRRHTFSYGAGRFFIRPGSKWHDLVDQICHRVTKLATLILFLAVKEFQPSTISTLASHQGEPGSIPGRVTGLSQVGIVPDDAAGRRAFSGISRFPRPFTLVPLHIHLIHPHRLSIPRCYEPPKSFQSIYSFRYTQHYENTARQFRARPARRGDGALVERASIALTAPALLDQKTIQAGALIGHNTCFAVATNALRAPCSIMKTAEDCNLGAESALLYSARREALSYALDINLLKTSSEHTPGKIAGFSRTVINIIRHPQRHEPRHKTRIRTQSAASRSHRHAGWHRELGPRLLGH
ncbi:hypothetical protein PR048_029319, partial [Dryococelus australis]